MRGVGVVVDNEYMTVLGLSTDSDGEKVVRFECGWGEDSVRIKDILTALELCGTEEEDSCAHCNVCPVHLGSRCCNNIMLLARYLLLNDSWRCEGGAL